MHVNDTPTRSIDTPATEHPTYSAPRLQRLGRISERTELSSLGLEDGNGYSS